MSSSRRSSVITRWAPPLAGAFLNLEPLVGVAVGWIGFGEAVAATQLAGGLAVLAGIALSTMPAGDRCRRGPRRLQPAAC